MKQVRIGVIGLGVIGQAHLQAFEGCPRFSLVAVADPRDSQRDAAAKRFPQIVTFADGMDLIRSGLVDAISIATPHDSHPALTIAALEQGLHVLTEKPVAVTAKAAQAMNDAANARPHLKYAVSFQVRFRPEWQLLKKMIDAGELGELKRVSWTITTWFRSQAYYDSAAWRATWKGEGGGLLINQCPHNLDLLQWLVGMPSRVNAHVALGKFHDIEVEDEVAAILHYPNGATGVFVASSGESPGVNRLEIVGDRSTFIVEAGKPIVVCRHETLVSQYMATTTSTSGMPPCTQAMLETPGEYRKHSDLVDNFAAAILDDAPLVSPGVEGIHSLELGNAMLMSGLTGRPVDLPMDRNAYENLLGSLCVQSRARELAAG